MDAVKALDDIYVYVHMYNGYTFLDDIYACTGYTFLNGIFNVNNTILWLQGYFKYFLHGVLCTFICIAH